MDSIMIHKAEGENKLKQLEDEKKHLLQEISGQ